MRYVRTSLLSRFHARICQGSIPPWQTAIRSTIAILLGGMAMKRREFVGLLSGAIAFPVSALAQPTGRRIGALWPFKETDGDGQAVFEAFRSGLRELGWGGAHIESRWGGG